MDLPVNTMQLYIVLSWIMLLHLRSASLLQGMMHEICHYESLNATCGAQEVVLMESARYGRMAAGRCVSREYGYVGCYRDVRDMVDSQCSGRRKCTVPVSYFVNVNVLPCPKDVTSYLEVSYRCLPVSHPTSTTSCSAQREILLSAGSGYISSYTTAENRLGTSGCPWVIKVQDGQKINFTLVDFGVFSRKEGQSQGPGGGGARLSPLYCEKYAEIREGSPRGQQTPICASDQREENVYVSKGSKVYVTLPRVETGGPHFLLKYQTIGCPRPRSSRGTTTKISGDKATVTCDATGESWQMSCREGKWHGKIGNCTGGSSDSSWTSLFGKEWSSSDGLLVVIALGVGLGIVIGVCLLAVALVILKKRGWRIGCGKEEDTMEESPDKNQVYGYNTASVAKAHHTYSSGYGSEALLNDNIPIDPRYNTTGHYGDINNGGAGSWVTSSAGIHGYNGSNLTRGSQSSLRHIYESPEFVNTVRGASGRDAC